MINAGVLNVLVTASTGQAMTALRKTQGQFRATAATAQTSATTTSGAWKKVGLGIAGVGAVVTGVSGKMAVDFDRAMRNVNSIAQLSEPQFKSLSQSVLDLAGPTAQAPQTLAEGMYDLVSSGFKADEALGIMKESAVAATAGLTTAATSTKAVAAVLNAYRLPAGAAGKVSDQLFRTVDRGVISFEELAMNIGDTLPFAASLKVGLDEVGAATATMTKQGLGAPETFTRIRNVLQSLIKPGDALKQTIKELGFESGDAMVQQLGLQGSLEKIVGTTDGTKDAVAKLFPNIRALGGVLALTGDNAGAANEDLKGLEKSSGATSRALEQQSKSVAYQWNKLKAEFSATAIEFGSKLLPVFIDGIGVLRTLGRAVVDLIGWVGRLPDGFKATATAALGTYAALKLVAFMAGTSLITGLGSAITTLRIIGMEFMTVAGSAGVLRGAWAALSLAFATNPIGATVVAVTGLTAAFFGLKAVLSGDDGISKLQERIADSSKRAKSAFKEQQGAMERLSDTSRKVRQTRRKEHDASDAVKRAEERLADVRENYPASARPAIQAQAALVRKQRQELHLSDRLADLKKKEGFARDAAKLATEKSIRTSTENIINLRQESKGLRRRGEEAWQSYKRTGQGANRVIRINKELARNEKDIAKEHDHMTQVLGDASVEIGTKFTKGLSKASKTLIHSGGDAKKVAGILKDPFGKEIQNNIGDLDSAAQEALQYGAGVQTAFRKANIAGQNSLGSLSQELQKAAKRLGIDKNVTFGNVRAKRQRGGAFEVPGQAKGDHVPVNLLLEPGETGFILNRHATQELKALKTANDMWPRAKMIAGGWIDPAGPGTGVVNPAIADVVGRWSTQYNAAINYGYDPGGGHVSPGHNVTGTATDTSPAGGWTGSSLALFERGLRALIGKVPLILYGTAGIGTPYPNHGRGNHAHIEWGMHPEIAGMIIDQIRRQIITGPPGILRDVAQHASDEVWRGANKWLQKQMAKFSSEGLEGSVGSGGMDKAALANLWRRANHGLGDPNTMAAIALAESSGNPTADNGIARGLWQIIASTWNAYGDGGWDNAFDPYMNAKAAGRILRAQGLTAWDVYDSGAYRQFLKSGGVAQSQRLGKHLKGQLKKIGRQDERIDIMQRLAERLSSPGGSELAAEEVEEQVSAYTRLMELLRKANRFAKRGLRVSKRGLKDLEHDKHVEHMQRKIEQERKKDKPNQDAIARWSKELDKLKADEQRDKETLKEALSSFRETKVEMSGVTGQGGRIFDTKMSLEELKEAGTSGALSGMTIDQFLAFSEAIRLGAFKSELPSFRRGGLHRGGWALVGEDGPELARMPSGTRVFSNPQSSDMLTPQFNVQVFVGDRELTDIVDVRIDRRDRRVAHSYRAGSRRGP